jgi:small conductance mechanosensitive channel
MIFLSYTGAKMQRVNAIVSIAFMTILCFSLDAGASKNIEPYHSVTVSNSKVDIDELELAIRPLLKGEVEVEVYAWLELLQAKATTLSEAEILVSQKQKGIETLSEIADISAEGAETLQQSTKEKNMTVEEIKDTKQEVKEGISQLKELTQQIDSNKTQKAVKTLTKNSDDLSVLSKKAEQYADTLEVRRNKLINSLTSLREEKNAVLDRFYLLLENWQAKGGDTAELRLYADSLTGANVDLSDGNAAWLTFKGWLSSKDGGLLWLENIVKFFIALAFVYLISYLIGKITDAALNRNKKISLLLKTFIQTSIRRVIVAIGFLVSLSIIGINVGPVLALIGAAGLVIGLALQSTLSNFASGMLILIYRPFDVGEVIEIDGIVGTVDSMTLLSTAIKTFDNQHLIVPNNNVWGTTIINVTGSKTRRVDLVFGIGYSDDMDKAQAIIEDVLSRNEMVLEKPEALVKVHELADSSVNFICRPWVKTTDYWDVYWDITREVKEQFDKQGVSIPFPQRDIHVHQISAPS